MPSTYRYRHTSDSTHTAAIATTGVARSLTVASWRGNSPSNAQARNARVAARKLIGSHTYVQNTKETPRITINQPWLCTIAAISSL